MYSVKLVNNSPKQSFKTASPQEKEQHVQWLHETKLHVQTQQNNKAKYGRNSLAHN